MRSILYVPTPNATTTTPAAARRRGGVVVAAVQLAGDVPDARDRCIVRMAARISGRRQVPLHVVHAWSFVGESILACPTRGLGAVRARRVLVRLASERRRRLDALLHLEDSAEGAERVLKRGPVETVLRSVLDRTGADVLVAGRSREHGFWGWLRGDLVGSLADLPGLSVLAVVVDEPRPGRSALLQASVA